MSRLLYLSVTADGVISLWDSEEIRSRGALAGEVLINLRTTLEQEQQIERATDSATTDTYGNHVDRQPAPLSPDGRYQS